MNGQEVKRLCADYTEDLKTNTDDVATQIVKQYIKSKEERK